MNLIPSILLLVVVLAAVAIGIRNLRQKRNELNDALGEKEKKNRIKPDEDKIKNQVLNSKPFTKSR